jgi:hypothetical protein
MAIPDPLFLPPPEPDAARSFGRRLIGAARLDPTIYEEVEADPTATGQALAVVLLSSLGASLGSRVGFNGIVVGLLTAMFLWYVWATLTWWIGTRLLPGPNTDATVGELMRTLGFASGPGMVQVFGLISPLQVIATVVSAVWMLAAGMMAVRQALDYTSTWRALVVVGIGWALQWLVLAVVLIATRAL